MKDNFNFEIMDFSRFKGYTLIFDTETAGTLESPIPYDFSLAIYNKEHKKVFAKTYLVSEIWNNPDLYNKSFYGISKRGTYNTMLEKKRAEVLTAKDFNKVLGGLIKNNNVKLLLAYNISFDLKAYNNLCIKYNLVNKLERLVKCDIQLLTQERLRGNQKFYKWCKSTGAITNKGYASVKVDNVYKYLFKSNRNEEHVGGKDIKQEYKIFKRFILENPYIIINQFQSFTYFLKDLLIPTDY